MGTTENKGIKVSKGTKETNVQRCARGLGRHGDKEEQWDYRDNGEQ